MDTVPSPSGQMIYSPTLKGFTSSRSTPPAKFCRVPCRDRLRARLAVPKMVTSEAVFSPSCPAIMKTRIPYRHTSIRDFKNFEAPASTPARSKERPAKRLIKPIAFFPIKKTARAIKSFQQRFKNHGPAFSSIAVNAPMSTVSEGSSASNNNLSEILILSVLSYILSCLLTA